MREITTKGFSAAQMTCSSFTEINSNMEHVEMEFAKKSTVEYKTQYSAGKIEKEQKLKKEVNMFQKDFEKMVSKSMSSKKISRKNCPRAGNLSGDFNKSEQSSIRSSLHHSNFDGTKSKQEYVDCWEDFARANQCYAENYNESRNPKENYIIGDQTIFTGIPPINNIQDVNSCAFSSMPWQTIETLNIKEIVQKKKIGKFFPLDVKQQQIFKSLTQNGLFELPNDIYRVISFSSAQSTKYFLLQEYTTNVNNGNQLVGIARLCEPIPDLDEYSFKQVYVTYLCLSRSGIDLRSFNADSDKSVKNLLDRYLQVLNDNAGQPFIPNIFPYSGISPNLNFQLRTNVKDDLVPVYTTTIVDDINKDIAKRKLFQQVRTSPVDVGAMTETNTSSSRKTLACIAKDETSTNDRHHTMQTEKVTNLYIPSDISSAVQNRNFLRPFKNLQNKYRSLNNDDGWRTLEYENLDEIADWVRSKFIMCDVTLKSIEISLEENGLLKVEASMCNVLGDIKSTSTFLILRDISNKKIASKPVIGIAFVVANNECTCDLKVVYLCLSRPKYVGAPWCDEESFTHGQELAFKEDIRILMDEYKMSLRYQKADPLFPNIYPLSREPPPIQMKTDIQCLDTDCNRKEKGSLYLPKTSRNTSKDWDKCKPVNQPIDNHIASSISSGDKTGRGEDEPLVSVSSQIAPITSQKGKDAEGRKQSPQKSSTWTETKERNRKSPNRKQTSPKKPETPTQKEAVAKEPNIPTPKQSPAKFPSSPPRINYKTSRLMPNLKGLYVGCSKNLSQESWLTIERNNLQHINSIVGDVKFFLCDTNLRTVRQSFKHSLLEISHNNMENIALITRGRKYLVLRAHMQDQNKQCIIGVANVQLSGSLTTVPNKKGYYYVKVLYYCLSLPFLRGNPLSKSTHFDGMDLSLNVAYDVCQQYMLCLKQGKVRSIFNDIYPWSGSLPPCKTRQSSSNSSISSPLPSPKSTDQETEHVSIVDGTASEVSLLSLLDTGVKSAVNFSQIEKELSELSVKTSPAVQQQYAPSYFENKQTPSKETVEGQYQKFANAFAHEMDTLEKNNSSHGHTKLLNAKVAGVNGCDVTPRRGRGRGRGTLMLQQAGLLPF